LLGIATKYINQGSTKVFKARQGGRAAIQLNPQHESLDNTTQNTTEVTVSQGGALFLLPDPVTCFRSARYNQIQRFRLSSDASAVLLDWITCGRKSLGEEWAFTRYYSVNELWVNGKRLLRDVLLLEDDQTTGTESPHPPRALRARLAPYSCYANLILYGPRVRDIVNQLSRSYGSISVFKFHEPPELIWSLSPVSNEGCIIRVAGKDSEPVKRWLKHALLGLENIVGVDVYRRAFV
jgi:urease accessory protein